MNNSTFNGLIFAFIVFLLGAFGLCTTGLWLLESKAPWITWIAFLVAIVFSNIIGAGIYCASQPIK